jgi:hypothetical protein
MPVLASAVPDDPMCNASVANPEADHASATVESSLTTINGTAVRKFPADGQFPTAAIIPRDKLVPAPGSPPNAYR